MHQMKVIFIQLFREVSLLSANEELYMREALGLFSTLAEEFAGCHCSKKRLLYSSSDFQQVLQFSVSCIMSLKVASALS